MGPGRFAAMARALRVEYEGAIYHVTFRGNERRDIFRDDGDRQELIGRLRYASKAHGVRVYLVCLMTNHVHLLVETPRANLQRFMQGLLTGYSVYFNRRHRRSGHLMQGRYGAQVVENGEYLLGLSRYIHLNPVFVHTARRLPLDERKALLRSYPWSTYRSYAGTAKRWSFVDYAAIMEAVKGRTGASYGHYVEAGLARTDEEWSVLMKGRPAAIGSAMFCRMIGQKRRRLAGRRRRDEGVLGVMSKRHAVGDVLAALAKAARVDVDVFRERRRDSDLRAYAAWGLQRFALLTQRRIGQVLCIGSGPGVGNQLCKWRDQVEPSRRGRKLMKRAAVLLSEQALIE
jgi:REP element-mobilizing transposase RayT